MRVVSLVPSVTETLLSWGITPVAVTRYCEQPSLVAVGGTKDPDTAAVVALEPDLVVMNDEENRLDDAEALRREGVPVHVLTIDSVEDVAPGLAALRARLGLPAAPTALLPPPEAPRLRAFVPVWRRPWMTMHGGTYGSSLLARLGVVNVFADHPERYPTVTLDEAAARAPDVVLAPSEPYPFTERQRPELEAVGPFVPVDGQDLFWWGSRTAAAVERLGDAIFSRRR